MVQATNYKRALVTGGAGFIGRWLVKRLLEEEFEVWVIDNLENGRESNLDEFRNHPLLKEVVYTNILNENALRSIFRIRPDIVYHLAAQINVHESLKYPRKASEVNIRGTLNILEECRPLGAKALLMGTCMVYDMADSGKPIGEDHPLKPASPYAASKLSAEILAESYHYSYNLPIVTCRPFNTYGPYQKSNQEGGVVSIFVRQLFNGDPLAIYGDGTQTRDLLYVEDCVDFIYKASICEQAVGKVINAGLGKDISILDLAKMICPAEDQIQFTEHHHPQSEIKKLVCDNSRAYSLLGWEPKTDLSTGIEILKEHLLEECVLV